MGSAPIVPYPPHFRQTRLRNPAYATRSDVDYLISCSCGHTIEEHDFYAGCTRCTCPRHRGAAIEALIETIRTESSKPDTSTVFVQLGPQSR
jgi:hypothetical protein